MNSSIERTKPSRIVSGLAWGVYLFLSLPSLIVIPMSFSDSSEFIFPPHEWSLGLYRKMLDPANGWVQAIARSTYVAAATVAIALVLGICGAYGLERSRLRRARWIEFLFMAPIFIPSIVLALSLYICFAYVGLAGSFLCLVASHVVLTVPFVILTTRAGLKQIDTHIEVAAAVMGATQAQIFLRVVLPIIRPSILAAAFLAFLLSFDEVVVAWFVGSTYQPTLPVKMYSSLQWEISPVLAAISTVLLTLTCVACVAAALTRKDKTHRNA